MGFRKGFSTTEAVYNLVTDLNQYNHNNQSSACVFIDFSKAFDCIQPNILLKKLKSYGLSVATLKWFANYFSGRTQMVRIGNSYSKALSMTYGVPQGSILGPLMFIIYINDLPMLKLSSKLIMYADDLVIYYSDLSWPQVKTTITADLLKIISWTYVNRLSINFSKSKLQLLPTRQYMPAMESITKIDVGLKSFERVETYNYLGIILDPDLKFEKAMLNAYARFSHKLYTLSVIRKDINQYTAVILVKPMLLPYYDYVLFLLTACTNKLITKMQRLVSRALRIALREDRRSNVNSLYSRTNVMKIELRSRYVLKIMFYKACET